MATTVTVTIELKTPSVNFLAYFERKWTIKLLKVKRHFAVPSGL